MASTGLTALPLDLQDELAALGVALEGLERARFLAIASLCCAVYDYTLTLDQEVRVLSRYSGWGASV